MRALALLLLSLATAAHSAEHRRGVDRLSQRLDRRDRRGVATKDEALLRAFPPATPTGLTFARTSDATCQSSTSAFSSLGANAACVTAASALQVSLPATNLVPTADRRAFDSAGWTKTGATVAAPTVTANAAAGPDGTTVADRVDFPAVSNSGEASTVSAALASTSQRGYALSVYVRAVSGSASTYLWAKEGSVYARRACAVTSSAWRRCVLPFSARGGTVTYGVGVDLTSGSGMAAQPATSVYVDAAQVEVEAVPTPYVPGAARTVGTASFPNPVPAGTAAWCVAVTARPRPVQDVHVLWQLGDSIYLPTNVAMYLSPGSGQLILTSNDAAGASKLAYTSPTEAWKWHNGDEHQFMGCLKGDSTFAIYLDGVAQTVVHSGSGAGVLAEKPTTLYVGSARNEYGGNADVRGVCVSLAPEDCLGTGAATTATTRIGVLGDSISAGYGGQTSYASKLNGVWATDGSSVRAANTAYSGSQVAGALSQYRAVVKGKGYQYVIALIGTNDLGAGFRTGAQLWTDLQALYDEVRADGSTLVPVTLPPRAGSGGWTPTMQGYLESVNANILAYCTAHSLTCVDAYAAMGANVDATAMLSAYDSGDHLHPSQAGHDKLATLVLEALGL